MDFLYCLSPVIVTKLVMITLRNHAARSYMTLLPVTLSVLDMIIVQSAAR